MKRTKFEGFFVNSDNNYKYIIKGFQQFMELTEGKQIKIECKEVRVSDTVIRSSAQNRFFHGVVCKALCRAKQDKYTIDDAKKFLKEMFLGEVIGVMNGKTILHVKETKDLTMAEMSDFITKCLKHMSNDKKEFPDFYMTTNEYDEFINSVGESYIQHHELRII